MNAARTLLLSTLATASLLAFPKLGGMAAANPGVQKCVDASGTVSYTDGTCGAMGVAVALPGHLARIVEENEAAIGYDAQVSVSAPSTLGPRSAQSGCARNPAQLQSDIGYAFASRDLNRIAGNYHWVGLGHRDARGILGKLETMAETRIARSDFIGGAAGQSFATSALQSGDAGNVGLLRIALADGTPMQMQVTRYRGCFFARF